MEPRMTRIIADDAFPIRVPPRNQRSEKRFLVLDWPGSGLLHGLVRVFRVCPGAMLHPNTRIYNSLQRFSVFPRIFAKALALAGNHFPAPGNRSAVTGNHSLLAGTRLLRVSRGLAFAANDLALAPNHPASPLNHSPLAASPLRSPPNDSPFTPRRLPWASGVLTWTLRVGKLAARGRRPPPEDWPTSPHHQRRTPDRWQLAIASAALDCLFAPRRVSCLC